MELKRVESAEDLRGLLGFSDDATEYLECERSEWVQFLVQHAPINERIAVWVFREEGGLKGYVVCVDGVTPPLFWGATILYVYAPAIGRDVLADALNDMTDWAKARGARYLDMNTRAPRLFARYGFRELGYTMMRIDL